MKTYLSRRLINLKNLATGEQQSFRKDDIAGITDWIKG